MFYPGPRQSTISGSIGPNGNDRHLMFECGMTERGSWLDADEVKGAAASSIDELGARRSSRQPTLGMLCNEKGQHFLIV
jgi:hypothetical protein